MLFKDLNIKTFAKLQVLVLFLLAIPVASLWAQADKKFIRHGNRQYGKEKFSESEIMYRKAIDKNKGSADAVFNTGDALYKQKKYEDASRQFTENQKMYEDKEKKSTSLYNLGNSLLMADKVKESIEAYKNSLRLDPDNKQAKYNLAYAQDLLKKQEQQQQQDQKDNKDQNKDQEKKDDQKKDNDQQADNSQDKNKQEQQNSQQQSISKEDAERLLNAIANDEKNVQEKVKLAKAAKDKVNTLKNW